MIAHTLGCKHPLHKHVHSVHIVVSKPHAAVDGSQGYLASLASAVSTLEAATANLNTSTSALGPLLNSTFGAAGAQAEVTGAAAAAAAFQVGCSVGV